MKKIGIFTGCLVIWLVAMAFLTGCTEITKVTKTPDEPGPKPAPVPTTSSTAAPKPSPVPVTPTPTKVPSAKLLGPVLIDAGPPPATGVRIEPTAIVRQPYALQLPAFGGRPPYRWELVSGSLPPGLNLDAAGRIFGTPTKSAHYQFTLILKDAEGTEVTQSVTLTAAEIKPRPTSQGEGGPMIVSGKATAALVLYEAPAKKASVSVIIPADYSTGRFFALLPCVQGGEWPLVFRLVGLPKALTYDASTGLIQGELAGLTESSKVDVFLRTNNGLEAQTSFTLKPPSPPTTYMPPAPTKGATTNPTVDTSKQYIEVWVSPSTYGTADIWIDGNGPYRQQVRLPASVGVHTIRIQTYGSYAGYSRTVNGSVEPGKYWSYQMK